MLLQRPIDGIRNGAYHLLIATVKALPHFAAMALFQNDTLRKYWFDRNTEFTKEGREWKFALISALAEGPAAEAVSAADKRNIDRYLKHGPHYVEPQFAEPATLPPI